MPDRFPAAWQGDVGNVWSSIPTARAPEVSAFDQRGVDLEELPAVGSSGARSRRGLALRIGCPRECR